jgi:hypothetical protein
MVRLAALLFVIFGYTSALEARPYNTLIRCQLVDGYELAVQNAGKAYYLSLMYGGKIEYRQRLKKPNTIRMNRQKDKFNFELLEPGTEQYLVKIAANFDEESSFNEIVHYKIRPRTQNLNTYKLYEAAGDGLPLKELGCIR